QLELGFLRSSRGLAALGDVLHSAAGRLHHLVAGSAAAVDVTLAETYRDVVDQLRQLEAPQLPVSAVLRDQRLVGPHDPNSPRISTASSSASASIISCSGPSIMMRARGSVPL